MTKREYEITDINTILTILDRCKIIHLALCDGNLPYVLPMNYGYIYENNTLIFYLHGAKEGHKYDIIRKNPNVSFEMECDVVPFEGKTSCQYGMSYSSVFGNGTAVIINDAEEKIKSLSILMKTQTGQDFEFNEKLASIVNVIKITVTNFSAKRRPIPGESI